jgi:hypothetical protein
MRRKISVYSKKSTVRNAVFIVISLIAVVFGAVSLARIIWGGEAIAEDSSGLVPGDRGQNLYAYVKAGEKIEVILTLIPQSEGGLTTAQCDTLTFSPNSLYCAPGYPISSNPQLAAVEYIQCIGQSYPATGDESDYHFGFFDQSANDYEYSLTDPPIHVSTSAATEDGICRLRISQDPALFMRFRWEVNVLDGSTKKPGRIWTDEVSISQISPIENPRDPTTGTAKNLVYYAQRSDGYRYEITQFEYNGFGSTLKVGAFGVGTVENVTAGKCISAYESVNLTADSISDDGYDPWEEPYIPDPIGHQGKSLDNISACSKRATYRIFFEVPDTTLPENAARWDGKTEFGLYRADPLPPTITASFEDTNNRGDYSGQAVIMNHDSYYGNAALELDTDGDSRDNYDVKIPFGITDFETRISLDGTKNNNGGAKIPINTLVKGRVRIEHVGEMHVLSGDIEKRGGIGSGGNLPGGIEVQRKNGSAPNRSIVFWNDMTGLSSARATVTPVLQSLSPTGTASDGGVHAWGVPITYEECFEEIVDGTRVIRCPFDKIGHNNRRDEHSWGDNRIIEDWTYDIAATELHQQRVLEESYFEYMFVDCTATDAQFVQYLEYLENNFSDHADRVAQASMERATCPSTPPSNTPNGSMTLSELTAYFKTYAEAVAFRETCDDPSSPPPPQPPKSGAHR